MNTNIFTLSPFCSPREKVTFPKYAILLIEQKDGPSEKNEGCLSARPSSLLADELMPKQSAEEAEDIVGALAEVLQARITSHSGENSMLLTAKDVTKRNSPALVPLMYRIAAEDFAKNNRSIFKIIECRNGTKLVSDWKPSLPDTLVALKHQVIVVQLKDTFIPYNDFAYAILRQLDYDWKLRLPRSFFYPNDVCKIKATHDRELIVVTPSMPDGDLEVSRKMSTLNYELIMMFKRSCQSAMKNHLLMRDLRVGKFQDTVDAVQAIRHIYKKLQDRLRGEDEIRLGSGSHEDLHTFLRQSGSVPLSAEALLEYSKRLGFDEPNSTRNETDKQENLAEQIMIEKDNLEALRLNLNLESGTSSARKPMIGIDFSLLDEKLTADFGRIQLLISGSGQKLEPDIIDKLDIEDIGKLQQKENHELYDLK